MNRSMKTRIFGAALAGLAIILTLAATGRAAAPELINFQGKLTNPTGGAITSAVPMVFKLYTAATGGAAAWTETQTVTPDESGIYSVLLGSVTALNLSFSSAYWLGVTVGADAEMTPRYQLVSSAYSLYSINSGTAAYGVNSGTAAYAVDSGTSAWATATDWAGITNKPAIGVGDAVLSATQTFTELNTFSSGILISSGIWSLGGDQRGLHSADLQTSRLQNTQVASGAYSVISGGAANTASGGAATVSGGYNNTASGGTSNVSGGQDNTASGLYVNVSGGLTNTASGDYSNVSGGSTNQASGSAATVSGGAANIAAGPGSTVSGGQENTASGIRATVAGGQYSTASGDSSFAAGYKSSSTAHGTFTWADGDGYPVVNDVVNRTWFKNGGGFLTTASTNTADGGLFLNANNFVGIGTLVPTSTLTVVGTFKLADGTQGAGKVLTSDAAGLASWGTAAAGDAVLAATQTFTGQNTFSYGVYFSSTIQSAGSVDGIYGPGVVGNPRGANAVDLQTYRGDAANVASGNMSVIGGGMANTANNEIATVSGGANNTASGAGATVAGGGSNTASGTNAAVAGGNTNTASNQFTVVAGGASNRASGIAAAVAGGEYNIASGQYAVSAGGQFNSALGDFSFAAGKASSSTAAGAFTWGDSQIGGDVVLNNVADRTWFKNRGGFLISTTTVASSAAFAVGSTGKVGIGTTNPGAVLEVNGNILFSQGAARTLSVATTVTNSSGTNLTIAAGAAQQSGVLAYPGGNLYLTGGSAYSMGAGNNWGGSVFLYGGNGEGGGPAGDVILAHDSSSSKGNVGIGTMTPKATLDVNGFVRLARNSSQPLACDAAHDGAMALTNTTKWKICVCDGGATAWKFISDGTACAW